VADAAGGAETPPAGGFWPVVDCAATGLASAATISAIATAEIEPRRANMEPAPPNNSAGKHAAEIPSFSCLDIITEHSSCAVDPMVHAFD
jgi:hypothetical protein